MAKALRRKAGKAKAAKKRAKKAGKVKAAKRRVKTSAKKSRKKSSKKGVKAAVKRSGKAKRLVAKTKKKAAAKKAGPQPKKTRAGAARRPPPAQPSTPAPPSAVPGNLLEKTSTRLDLPNVAASVSVDAARKLTPSQAVTRCVNGYLQEVEPEWNNDGRGNEKTLGELHIHVPLFLAGVCECLEAIGYTFDTHAVGQTVHSDTTVSDAKQEIRNAVVPFRGRAQ